MQYFGSVSNNILASRNGSSELKYLEREGILELVPADTKVSKQK